MVFRLVQSPVRLCFSAFSLLSSCPKDEWLPPFERSHCPRSKAIRLRPSQTAQGSHRKLSKKWNAGSSMKAAGYFVQCPEGKLRVNSGWANPVPELRTKKENSTLPSGADLGCHCFSVPAFGISGRVPISNSRRLRAPPYCSDTAQTLDPNPRR